MQTRMDGLLMRFSNKSSPLYPPLSLFFRLDREKYIIVPNPLMLFFFSLFLLEILGKERADEGVERGLTLF